MGNSTVNLKNKTEKATPDDIISLQVVNKVTIQGEEFTKSNYSSAVSLLACSSKNGYFVSGHNQGFIFGSLETLQGFSTAPLKDPTIVTLRHPISQLGLSLDENTIVMALTDGSLISYSVTDILILKSKAKPKHTINTCGPIFDLRLNNGNLPNYACVLSEGNQCRVVNWKKGGTIVCLAEPKYSAICWSPDGKAFVCGRTDGYLEMYNFKGTRIRWIRPPQSMKPGHGAGISGRQVHGVLWISVDEFLVVYSSLFTDKGEGYIINRRGHGSGKYNKLMDIAPIRSPEGRFTRLYMEMIRDAPIVILANGSSNQLWAVVKNNHGVWKTLDVPNSTSLFFPEKSELDTFPFGLALYSAPHPILLHLNDQGVVSTFNCQLADKRRQHTAERLSFGSTPTIPFYFGHSSTESGSLRTNVHSLRQTRKSSRKSDLIFNFCLPTNFTFGSPANKDSKTLSFTRFDIVDPLSPSLDSTSSYEMVSEHSLLANPTDDTRSVPENDINKNYDELKEEGDLPVKLSPNSTTNTATAKPPPKLYNDSVDTPDDIYLRLKKDMAKELDHAYQRFLAVFEKMSTLQADFGKQLQNQDKKLDAMVKEIQQIQAKVDNSQTCTHDVDLANLTKQNMDLALENNRLKKLWNQNTDTFAIYAEIELECDQGDAMSLCMGTSATTHEKDLERQLAVARFHEIQRKSALSASTITFDDLTDDDRDD